LTREITKLEDIEQSSVIGTWSLAALAAPASTSAPKPVTRPATSALAPKPVPRPSAHDCALMDGTIRTADCWEMLSNSYRLSNGRLPALG